MKVIASLRLLACILLVGSLTLPLSTCTSGTPPHTEYNYVLPEVITQAADGPAGIASAAIILLAFTWPLLTSWLAFRRTSRRAVRVRLVLEPLLLGGSGWYLYYALLLNDPAPGAYVSSSGFALYFGAWIVEVSLLLRARRARPRGGPVGAT